MCYNQYFFMYVQLLHIKHEQIHKLATKSPTLNGYEITSTPVSKRHGYEITITSSNTGYDTAVSIHIPKYLYIPILLGRRTFI